MRDDKFLGQVSSSCLHIKAAALVILAEKVSIIGFSTLGTLCGSSESLHKAKDLVSTSMCGTHTSVHPQSQRDGTWGGRRYCIADASGHARLTAEVLEQRDGQA